MVIKVKCIAALIECNLKKKNAGAALRDLGVRMPIM
jgi:hypothetical protein